MFSLSLSDQAHQEECRRVENRAENAEEELSYLKAEVSTAHRVLDAHVGRSVGYRGCGERLMALSERIDAMVESILKSHSDGWEKYRQQIRANETLMSDLKALWTSFDLVEAENLNLSERLKLARLANLLK